MSRKNQWNPRSQDSWGTNNANFKKPRPRGLKGKEIGLYYKSLHASGKKNLEYSITLNVPKPVIDKLIYNLDHIIVLAKKHGIKTCRNSSKFKPIKESSPSTSGYKPQSKYGNKMHPNFSEFKDTNEFETRNHNNNDDEKECETNQIKIESPDDFVDNGKGNIEKPIKNELYFETNVNHIKIEQECEENCINIIEPNAKLIKIEPGYEETSGSSSNNDSVNKRVLALRHSSDYKYGYNDIITGTFTEKLDESLASGIKIAQLNNDIASLNVSLYENYLKTLEKKQYKEMMVFRSKLPTYKKRDELIKIINNNQVVVISGETGCGKSTQVPQIILDDALLNKRAGNVKILVTQPRRIAASSLAARVASERAEAMGQSVGYAVRLEKTDPRSRGSILFCTTGILLVDLEVNQGLTEYSHVILDEVHERDVHIDVSMCVLKQVLQKRKDLKLILMSATLDAEKLCAFFNGCPMMHIEGLAYPVKDIYLEEVLQLTNFQLKPVSEPVQNNRRPHLKHLKKNKNREREITEKAIQYRATIAPWLESIKKNLNRNVYETLQDHRIEDLNIDLMVELIIYISKGPPGAILIFVPGISEITKVLSMINQNQSRMGGRFEVYPLHSKLASLEQNKIFQRPAGNIRKIIVATNIAETSITIDDIVYVIDSGKMKYNGLNVEEHMNTLKIEWIAKANLHQRRGRAGRCQPGVCYHLITSHRASKLEERILPELQRSDLLEPLLTIKRLRLGKAIDALKNVPDSPAETTISRAIKHLQQCGALEDNETLTPLGWHLARLPVHPAAGKLLLFGALFGCLDRCASVAAVWSFKDPFVLVLEKSDEIKIAKRELARGEPSDHVAISEAIIQWENCPRHHRKSFAYDYFLSHSTLELLSDMRKQLGDNLKQMGFLASGNIKSVWENRNSENLSLFKAIVAAALYPNVTAAKWINLNARNPNKQVRVKPCSSQGPLTIHPGSVMCPPQRNSKHQPPKVGLCSNPGANWLVYWLKQKSSEVFLIDITMVYTLPIIFFGELKVTENDNEPDYYNVSITSYKVRILKEVAMLLFDLRELLDEVLASKIMVSSNHAVQHSDFEEQVLNAVVQVITAEDERAEYLDESGSDYSESDSRR